VFGFVRGEDVSREIRTVVISQKWNINPYTFIYYLNYLF
jgi:hypothetical protein